MITRIQALNYRCLRYVDVALDRFHVLVGANASGKSTLFDAVSFVGDFVRDGLEKAVSQRAYHIQDLVWARPRDDLRFELALELEIPNALRTQLPKDRGYHTCRYELAVSGSADRPPSVESEQCILVAGSTERSAMTTRDVSSFPDPLSPPKTIVTDHGDRHSHVVVGGFPEQWAYRSERASPAADAWDAVTFANSEQSAIRMVPSSLDGYAVLKHVASVLTNGINSVFLDSGAMQAPSGYVAGNSPLAGRGAKLPWAVRELLKRDKDLFDAWLRHAQIELDDLVGVRVAKRPEDLTLYLMLKYKSGVEVPSWMVSDGSLRFLGLLLAVYMTDGNQVYLLDEPENGIHPMALDLVYDAMSSTYGSQLLVATHSPRLLTMASPKDVLCLARNGDGVDVVAGDRHPIVRGWQGPIDMEVLFAKEASR